MRVIQAQPVSYKAESGKYLSMQSWTISMQSGNILENIASIASGRIPGRLCMVAWPNLAKVACMMAVSTKECNHYGQHQRGDGSSSCALCSKRDETLTVCCP